MICIHRPNLRIKSTGQLVIIYEKLNKIIKAVYTNLAFLPRIHGLG